MSGHEIDYRAVETKGVDPEDYDYRQRRAELLIAVENAGGPRRINYAAMGRRYGVTRETIRKDMERLGEYVDESMGSDTTTLEGEAFLWRCARKLLENGEYRKAAQTYLDLDEWRRQTELDDILERIEKIEEELSGADTLDTSRFRIK